MADPPPYPDAGDDAKAGPEPEMSTSTPRWVKVFGIIAIVLALLFVLQLLVGGGRHGPNRHRLSDGGQTPATDVADVGTPLEAGQ